MNLLDLFDTPEPTPMPAPAWPMPSLTLHTCRFCRRKTIRLTPDGAAHEACEREARAEGRRDKSPDEKFRAEYGFDDYAGRS